MHHSVELVATACFALAILHTFLVKWFQSLAERFPEGSVAENMLHLLGEVEVVFGIWAAIFLGLFTLLGGGSEALHYLESRNFTEPAFVFVILCISATRPVLLAATSLLTLTTKLLPFLSAPLAFYCVALTVGPLLGSFITEPAAMTVTALILLDRFYSKKISEKLRYATLGLLFVNVSIGGTLTPYAAPPVLMVAKIWNWDLAFMLLHFGDKAALACVLSTALVAWRFRRELNALEWNSRRREAGVPFWITLLYFSFLAAVVISSHHLVVFGGVFLFFLGLVSVTREYQKELKLKEGLLVAFFLGGLVVLGGPQRWWLEPLLARLDALPLFLGSMGLTAITDNAALTYLGAQVPGLADSAKYALVAGSVVGGGLTVIANAPNPAGYGILNPSFGESGISPLRLFASALPPTVIAALCFWLL